MIIIPDSLDQRHRELASLLAAGCITCRAEQAAVSILLRLPVSVLDRIRDQAFVVYVQPDPAEQLPAWAHVRWQALHYRTSTALLSVDESSRAAIAVAASLCSDARVDLGYVLAAIDLPLRIDVMVALTHVAGAKLIAVDDYRRPGDPDGSQDVPDGVDGHRVGTR